MIRKGILGSGADLKPYKDEGASMDEGPIALRWMNCTQRSTVMAATTTTTLPIERCHLTLLLHRLLLLLLFLFCDCCCCWWRWSVPLSGVADPLSFSALWPLRPPVATIKLRSPAIDAFDHPTVHLRIQTSISVAVSLPVCVSLPPICLFNWPNLSVCLSVCSSVR